MRASVSYLDASRVIIVKVSNVKGICCIHLPSGGDERGRDLGGKKEEEEGVQARRKEWAAAGRENKHVGGGLSLDWLLAISQPCTQAEGRRSN